LEGFVASIVWIHGVEKTDRNGCFEEQSVCEQMDDRREDDGE
jgi:hypothetical protein